jgi:DNA-binding transcriptional LysR family regulator
MAPDIVVSAVLSGDRGFETALTSGNIDFAVGHLPELEYNFHHTVIGMHELVCVVRDGHPLLAGRLTRSALLSCSFAEVAEHGCMYGVLSRAIVRKARPDAMKYRTTNVMALPSVIAATDLVGILPAWFAARCAGPLRLRLLRLGAQPTIAQIRLFWHPNLEHDPGHLWMRSVIAQAAAAAQIGEALKTAAIDTVEDRRTSSSSPRRIRK